MTRDDELPEQDDDDREFYAGADDDDEFESFDCAMDRHGNCGKAGSEECDWEFGSAHSIAYAG